MMTDQPATERRRPSVSVIVPFFGDEAAAATVAAMLGALETEPGDELIVADNTPDGVFRALAPPGIAVTVAGAERSSYHARNAGAEAAQGDWILFIDADCRPPADLIHRYLSQPVPAEVAILAGPIMPAEGQRGLLPEWAASRAILSQEAGIERDPAGAATANLMVRRSAWAGVGGFLEGIRSGGDYEFCWRVADAGGRLELRPDAAVEHLHRTTLRGVARQMARYSAGNSWQRRRRPGSAPRPPGARALARAVAGSALFALSLRPRRAAMKLVDAVAVASQAAGAPLQNSVAPSLKPASGRLMIATDRFPVLSETFVTGEIAALRALGQEVRVEAVQRPARPALGAARGLDVRYLEDEGLLSRAVSLAWVLARHPLRAAADLRLRRRFAADERMPLRAIAPLARRLARGREAHVHVHFAALASVNALRAARVAGVRASVAPHGHEVFATPRALGEKLRRATFVTAPCEYTALHLRGIAPGAADRIHVVVMGVDGDRFRRRRPYPGGRTVVAVGRLVEKKGFAHLIDAFGLLDDRDAGPLLIAGDGPLLERLNARIQEAGLNGRARLLGALDSAAVKELLERADLLAMPCVVAADGDRDAMPVVVKEALAMEVPVVVSDEVGLPEVVEEEWGRLVKPADAAALARAIADLLALPAATRARMGAAGRASVLERFQQRAEAERLIALIRDSGGGI